MAKIVQWTADGKYDEGDLVVFPPNMVPPGQLTTWRVAETNYPHGDGYKWELPRIESAALN